jgi:CBS domain-containing protein
LEVRMAAAGPLTSFLIAGVLGAFYFLTMQVIGSTSMTARPIIATLYYAAVLNGVLGAFNLIPAFPLDGGRVLRGSLWNRSKNLLSATANATRVSEAISLLMMAVGLFFVVFGDFVNGLWIIFLGWFIRSGAETSLRQTRLTESLGGVKVGDIMTRDLLSVSPEVSVQQLVSDYFLVHPHGGYPVVSNGKLVGVVTMSSVRSIPREKRDYEKVSEAMVPFERTVTVSPTTSAVEALRLMAKNGIGRLVVMDGDKIAGMVTRGDLMKMMHARQELGR